MTLTNSSGSGSSERRFNDKCDVELRSTSFSLFTRAPASELYWAVVASLIDDGMVNANVLRREALTNERLHSSKRTSNQSAIRSG